MGTGICTFSVLEIRILMSLVTGMADDLSVNTAIKIHNVRSVPSSE